MADDSKDDADDGAASDASGSSDDSNSDDSNPVETLVAGRQRRVNAGNRMNALVQEEEGKQDEADEVTLLFAQEEDEVDEEYTSEEAEEGGDEFSSSDDEVENQNTAGDDFEGEKALERQEKVEKAKKRKAERALTSGANLRKKVKIDPNLPQESAQPKKPSKKDRKTFLPIHGENVRQSSRAHTQMQTSTTKVKILEDEIRTAKYRQQREKKERQRQREQPQQEVTQADRLAEAARIERKNLKSLNRWEESEKKRAEEQSAKLAALKDRSLNGPVVSWWSGKAVWAGPQLSLVGNKEVTQVQAQRTSTSNDEPKKRGRKAKALLDQQAALGETEGGTPSLGTPRGGSMTPPPSDNAATPVLHIFNAHPEASEEAPAVPESQPSAVPIMQLPENSFLQGIQEYATLHGQVPPLGSQVLPPLAVAPSPVQEVPTTNASPEPVIIEHSTRNLVILDQFDDLSSEGRKNFQVFYNKKAAKLGKPDREMCTITSSQARYRDPSTGISYANSAAFKKLQELKKHQYTWSSMLDCFVGKTGVVARGVPESFLGDGVPMRDIQAQPYARPAPLTVPPTPPHQPQPGAVA